MRIAVSEHSASLEHAEPAQSSRCQLKAADAMERAASAGSNICLLLCLMDCSDGVVLVQPLCISAFSCIEG